MPLDPKRVQAVFLSAVECQEPAARAAVLDRECSTDVELRRRVEALLRAYDLPDSLLDRPIVGAPGNAVVPLTGREDNGGEAIEAKSPGAASETSNLTVGLLPDADATGAVGAPSVMTNRAVAAIAGYEILGELGRGGMGVVYRARQIRLNRPCALKMILGGAHANEEAAIRFLAEAEAIARLQHPNVVQIHHVGVADGLPFFELEYVDGGSLDRRLNGTPWPVRRAAELIESVAHGVTEAHRLGIVHRDLKPGNVLLAADGTPKITDFGLAKSLAADSGLTRTDSIMGSPGYMAPEQAEGKAKHVGPLADVYALGAILYELLTGGPPFRGTTSLEILEQVKHAEPVPPSRLVPGLPRDVETIALKCLQKEPDKRYDSAAALSEDLRRFLGGEPIVARPVPFWERGMKWARRRPAITALIVAVHLLLALLLGLGIWSYAEIDRSLTVARSEGNRALEQTKIAQAQTKVANEQTEVANKQAEIATKKAEELAWEDYINRVNRAYREVQDDNVALAEDLLHGCPIERRGWEWHYVKRLCHRERLSVDVPAGSVSAVAYSPDSRLIATGSGGHFFGVKGGSTVELWDRESGQRRLTLPITDGVVFSLAFSPDGSKLALGTRVVPGGTNPQIAVRDAKTGETLWAKHEPRLPQAMSVAFSPDGKSLAVGFGEYSGGGAHPVKLYEVETGRETVGFTGPRGGVNDVAFHRDGRHLAVAGFEIVEVWDVVERTKVHKLVDHSKWVYCLAFSPDGKWLATGGWDRTIKLRDAATGEERLTIFGHEGFVLDLAFSPDSHSLASASEDRSVRLWEVPTGRPIGVFHGHTDFVQAVAFAPDGGELASGGLEGTMKVWGRRTSPPVVFEGHTGWINRLWYRRDGRRVVTEAFAYQVAGETTKGWDPGTGEPDPTLTGVDPGKLGDEYLPHFSQGLPPRPVASPDGNVIARVLVGAGGASMTDRSTQYANSSVEVRDSATGEVLQTLIGHTAEVSGIAFSPDRRRIATASYDRTIKLWDTATGSQVFTLRGHTGGLLVLAFSPDGQRIVSGAIDSTARVWDATPLPAEVLLAHDLRFQKKLEALREFARMTEDAQRVQTLAQNGQWDLAAAALAKFVEQEPDNLILWYSHIRSLIAAGNRVGVRRVCEDLLRRFGNTTSPIVASDVVRCCVLASDSVADHEAPVRLAEIVVAGNPQKRGRAKRDALDVLGAALYRAGRFGEAIRRLNESIQALDGGDVPNGFAFLAMAHHRLGHGDEAKRWLDKLVAPQRKKGADFSWDDVDIRILRREAESLILGNTPAVSTTAPATSTGNASGDSRAKPE